MEKIQNNFEGKRKLEKEPSCGINDNSWKGGSYGIAAAMSGGVDSSVAASLALEEGYRVTGFTMVLLDEDDGSAVRDAKAVCDLLGIGFFPIDLREEFRSRVISDFIEEYEAGRTPNPCVVCNREIKFGKLMDLAEESGFSRILSGHYARLEEDKGSGRILLKRGKDHSKDQSYMLYSLSQDQLAHIMLPLGDLSKDEVRRIAETLSLPNAHKKDSQDICFVSGKKYGEVIRHYTGKAYPPGKFITESGECPGYHHGIIDYTIGQRKGLGLSLDRPAYVLYKDRKRNEIIIGDEKALYKEECRVKNVNWIAETAPGRDIRAFVQTRYSREGNPAKIIPDGDEALIVFDKAERAITPGQSAVFYDGEYVLGGGIII